MTATPCRRRVLVTGARGFLGGRICRALVARPDLMVVGSSRSNAPPEAWPGDYFVRIAPQSGAPPTPEMLSEVEAIIHLAGPDQARSESDPLGALEATVSGTVGLLEAAIRAKVRRFIYVSSAHVYGTPLVGRIDETHPVRPAHPYAISRRTAEDFVLAAHNANRIQGVVVRVSNGIGAPAWREIDQWHTIGNELCRQAATVGRLTLSSSGEQWRDFVTLADVASAMLHILDLPSDLIADGVFNLGGEMPLRIIDVAEYIAKRAEALFGRRPPISRAEGQPLQSFHYCIDKFRATGFQPSSDLMNEIDATLRLCVQLFAPSPMTAVSHSTGGNYC